MSSRRAPGFVLAAVLLAWFDVPGYIKLVVLVRPLFGTLGGALFGVGARLRFRTAERIAREGLPLGRRFRSTPYEFVEGHDVGLVFYPGAGVEAAAYAPLLRQVAIDAKATVVLARIPFRHVITPEAFRELISRHPEVRTWAVGGHSLGGGSFGAMRIVHAQDAAARAAALGGGHTEREKQQQVIVPRGLAMLGAVPASYGPFEIDLSKIPGDKLETLVVLASEDAIASPKPGAKQWDGTTPVSDGFNRLPSNFRKRVIQGGNHGGFGYYGRRAAMDGEATISKEEQQDQAARHLVAFLKRVQQRAPPAA